MERPLIGINADIKCNKSDCFSVLHSGYYENIYKADALPVILPPTKDISAINCLLDKVSGVILCGGADLDPENDGWQRHSDTRVMDWRRESFDRVLVQKIREKRIPVLGIGSCMQLLNVHCGGQLSLHIPSDYPKAIDHAGNKNDTEHRHQILPRAGTWLHKVYGDSNVFVSSYHHMCVQELSSDFRISAVATDDIIEAIESVHADWFAAGVQFHPEVASATLLDFRLFEEFARLCNSCF